MVAFVAAGIPLLLLYGLRGFAIGVAIQRLANLACRAFYLRRLFDAFDFARHAVRAFLPVLPATALVLVIRVAEPGSRTLALAIGELVAYVAVAGAATWYLESSLVREAIGYVTRRASKARAQEA